MTVLNDAGPKIEPATSMAATSSPTVSAGAVTAPKGDDTAASTITVNTKAPAPNFPPPKSDKPRPHVCATCSRSFARLEHLKRHERSHTKEKPFECPECSRCFARRDLLLRHQQKLHQTTTPSSRPRNRRESASGVTLGPSRVRKNSVAGTNTATAAATSASMRPRANTISHVDNATMQMMSAVNASMARGPPAHSRHSSMISLPLSNINHTYAGMSAVMGNRGMANGLKLETHGLPNLDFSAGLRTAPPMTMFSGGFEYDSMMLGNTINPNALHYSDSPLSMGVDPTSPFSFPDLSTQQSLDEGFNWLPADFEHQINFHNGNDNAVDESSPSAISTTSQSGISEVMVDGSNNPASTAASTSSIWQPTVMGPPQMTSPFNLDLGGSVFPDLMSGAPVSPQPPQSKNLSDAYFSTSPPSLNSMTSSVMPGLNTQNLNQALNFGAGPETPTSMNGINHGTSPVGTITDSTRNAILGALSSAASQSSAFAGRKSSFSLQSSPLSPHGQSTPSVPDHASNLPSTQDLQRFVRAYLRFFHPHLPFLHVPTLSFEIQAQSTSSSRSNSVGGPACLVLSTAAIGALYEMEHDRSRELFEMAKKMIQTYLEQRRKANVAKAGFRRAPSDQGSDHDDSIDTPVWLVQSMLLNVVYGHNCGDKRAGEIASTHCAALSSLAQGAELLRPMKASGAEEQDVSMRDADGAWGGGVKLESDAQDEWLRWKIAEERKRTLYAVFILSSLLVSAYNHAPTLTNSEILLDLPCDEELFSAEKASVFHAKGGIVAANHNRVTFHDALGELLRTNEMQQKLASSSVHQPFGSGANLSDLPKTSLKPSTFGCLILINALHNYIWETRQRHHNKIWTNEETEKMHRHIEPALKAWQAAWASNPTHSLERPNPYGKGPLSADSIPLLDLAYVRLFVNLSRSKDKFWERDWDGMAEELSRGNEIIQHAEHSPASNSESILTDQSENSTTSSVFVDSPVTQSSSPKIAASSKLPTSVPPQTASQVSNRAISRREKHLRKAAFYAADSLSMADKLGITFADFTSRELPLQSAMCAFDCAQVLAEWVATLQDRLGRYFGILGQDEVDLSQIPAIMLLEEEDIKLLGKIQEILAGAEMKMNLEVSPGAAGMNPRFQIGDLVGYAAKILRVTAYMLNKAAVWPVTHLMAQCLETHANHMKARAEKSVNASE